MKTSLVLLALTCSVLGLAASRRAADEAIIEAAKASRAGLTRWLTCRDTVVNLYRVLRGRMGITRRPADWVLQDLGLIVVEQDRTNRVTRDLRDLKVLDAGCGRSSFGAALNQVEETTGTHVRSLDREDLAKEVPPGTDFVRGSIFDIPEADGTFDLTVSNWVLANMMGLTKASREASVPRLTKAIGELIRVTRAGGEVRFTISSICVRDELDEIIRAHSRVGVKPKYTDTTAGTTVVVFTVRR